MVSAISSALSAVNAFGMNLDVTANNIANANTARFKKSRVDFQESTPAGSGVTGVLEQVDTPGVQILQETSQGPQLVEQSNVDLGEEMMNLMITQRGYEANAHVIHTQDEVLGSLLSIMA